MVLHEQMEEVGLPGSPYEEGAPNHSPVPWLKTVVLERCEERKGVA